MAANLTRLTHKIAIQLHLVQLSLQAVSPETLGYTLVRMCELQISVYFR